MSTELVVGLILVSIGGFVDGSLGLILKLIKHWKWEHLWLVFTLVGYGIIPLIFGFLTVVDLATVLSSANKLVLGSVFVFGLGWGIGAVLYGVALRMAGMALSYPIVMSLTAAIGSLAPLAIFHRNEFATFRGHLIISAVFLVALGVVLSACAAHIKQVNSTGSHQDLDAAAVGRQPLLGVFVAILSGLFSPMINLSFAYGTSLVDLAGRTGTPEYFAPNVIWVVALSAGAIINAGYCGFIISKNRSWRIMGKLSRDWLLSLGMAALGPASFVLYGIGSTQLGELGSVIGWAVMSATGILGANLWGIVTGEWKGVPPRALVLTGVAVVLLILSVVLLGWANTQ